MSITVVQATNFGTVATTSPIKQSFGSTPSTGHAVIVAIVLSSGQFAPGTVSSVIDNQTGNSYSLIKGQYDQSGGNNCRVELWWCPSLSSASGAFTVSCAYTSADYTNCECCLMEVSGLGSSIDQTGGVGLNAAGGTVTANAPNGSANALVFAICSIGSFNTTAALSDPATSGYTSWAFDSGTATGFAAEASYKTVSAIETSAATWGWTGTDQAALAIATIDQAAPTITAQPQPETAYVGQTATFTVTATSSGGSLSYQWQQFISGSWSNVGTNSSSYTTGTLGFSDNGDLFRVQVTDSNGTTISNTAYLTVYGAASLAWVM